jgi:tetratricopeptide (TPR) repeat protein
MKINLFLTTVLAVTTLSIFSGCEKDWLGAKATKQQAIPATLKDFQAIVNSEGLNSDYSTALIEIASDGHYVTEAAWVSGNAVDMNAYTWSNERPYPVFYWADGPYARVFSMNVVLDGLNRYVPADEERVTWNNIRGQALFHRADAFYRAAVVWTPPYNPATAESDMGIPLRLEADLTIASRRSTVKQTYAQIINDLLESAQLLSPDFKSKTLPYKRSAFALLARVYLEMREYSKAGAYADSCLEIEGSLLDYNNLSTSTNFIGDVNNNPEIIFFSHFLATRFTNASCLIDADLYSLYEENDLRRTIFFKVNADGSVKFKGNYNSSASRLFSGLANDELYLIRAECFARSGEITSAMKDLNDLLRTRWKKNDGITTYVDKVPNDASESLRLILTERRKELLLRGLRWTDLRRLNFEDDFKITLTRTIGGNTFILEPRSFRYAFPLPNEVISMTSMPQNIGW